MDNSLIYPVLAQVWWILIIAILTLKARADAYQAGKVQVVYFKHNRGKAPETMVRWGDNLQNQFELPVLFYLIIGLLLITQSQDVIYSVLAWLFVASRMLHSYIHIKTNHIGHRRNSFLIGFLTIAAMWSVYTLQLLTQ